MATTADRSSSTERLSDQELRAWRGLLRTHAFLSKALDADLDAQHDLPLTSYEVLLYLADAEGQKLRMHDLAERVLLSRSGLTRLIDRMERDGLIRRETCPSDARGSFAALTDAGREKFEAARSTHLAGIRALFLDRFSPAELDAIGDVWERVLPAGCASVDKDTATPAARRRRPAQPPLRARSRSSARSTASSTSSSARLRRRRSTR
jgi:DNA-binding MarR family transcriptional regulator